MKTFQEQTMAELQDTERDIRAALRSTRARVQELYYQAPEPDAPEYEAHAARYADEHQLYTDLATRLGLVLDCQAQRTEALRQTIELRASAGGMFMVDVLGDQPHHADALDGPTAVMVVLERVALAVGIELADLYTNVLPNISQTFWEQ